MKTLAPLKILTITYPVLIRTESSDPLPTPIFYDASEVLRQTATQEHYDLVKLVAVHIA